MSENCNYNDMKKHYMAGFKSETNLCNITKHKMLAVSLI